MLNLFEIASNRGHLDIIKLLVDNKADINAIDNDGDNAVSEGFFEE